MNRWLASSLLAVGCTAYDDGDYLHVRHDGADMPIWVTGNRDSEAFVLLLHGGPGASALVYHLTETFQELEEDYGVVYWDQRASGAAQGNPHPSTFTLEQYVEDMDVVVDTIHWRYPDRSLFVLGHSWGGALGSAYLLDEARQRKVTGWIEMDGAHALGSSYEWSRPWALAQIEQQLPGASRRRRRKLEAARRWYDAHDSIGTADDIDAHTGFIDDLGGYIRDPDVQRDLDRLSRRVLFSPVSPLATDQSALMEPIDVLSIDLTDSLDRIEIPSLILWGEHDGVLPVEQGQQAYAALGTPEPDKRLVVFEHSAHSPFFEEPDAFLAAVGEFIDAH